MDSKKELLVKNTKSFSQIKQIGISSDEFDNFRIGFYLDIEGSEPELKSFEFDRETFEVIRDAIGAVLK